MMNDDSTTTETIIDQMNEPRPLPMGRQEFEVWAARIISGALVGADVESQKFVLCNQILGLGPTEDHKPDAYFIHSLRKFASNQVADAIRTEIRVAVKARIDAEEKSINMVKDSVERASTVQ